MDRQVVSLSRFKGEANAGVSDKDMAKRGYLEKAVNVDIFDDGSIRSRDGYQRICLSSGTAHSLWASRDVILVRQGSQLCRFDIGTASLSVLSSSFLNQKLPVCYRDIAGEIYLMDGVTAGRVNNLNYSTWATPYIGKTFDNYISRMFIPFGNYLFYSRPWNYTTYDAREYIGFDEEITMVEAVRAGIWIGTINNVYFLAGEEPPLNMTHILDRGVIPNTAVKLAGGLISTNFQNEVVIFTTTSGIFMGGDQGFPVLVNMTPHYKPPKATSGSAYLRRLDGLLQYVVFLNDATPNGEGSTSLQSEASVMLPLIETV